MQSNVYVGLKPANNEDYNPNLPDEFDYLLLPLTNNRYKLKVRSIYNSFIKHSHQHDQELIIPEPQLQELSIPPFIENLNHSFIGLLSSWIELENNDPIIRDLAYKILYIECNYAKFIGIKQVILAPPRNLTNLNYYTQIVSKLLNSNIFQDLNLILSISLPLFEDSEPLATWELWNTIRKICNYNKSLTISLAVPKIKTPSFVIKRWLSEPVSSLLLSSSIFTKNNHNYPVLNKFNQNLISNFQKINANNLLNLNELSIILHGIEKNSNDIKGGKLSYLEYINFLLRKGDSLMLLAEENSIEPMSDNTTNSNNNTTSSGITNATNTDNNNNSNGNSNNNNIICLEQLNLPRLLPPLKPHSNMLTNFIYKNFENDKIKYNLYENAINRAIYDIRFKFYKENPLNILILGPGRGPLIDKTYQILKDLKMLDFTNIYAIEKNSNAFLYLQNKNFNNWNNKIKIINSDIFHWNPTKDKNEKLIFNLCISELLGSFGCNELSPEILYHIERNFTSYGNDNDTIFIPNSCSSYIAPIFSPLMYQYLLNKPLNSNITNNTNSNFSEDNFEKPWVLHNLPYTIVSSKINEIWSFKHPMQNYNTIQSSNSVINPIELFNKNSNSNNDFKIKHKCEIHGFIGYFTANLYENITLSTIPTDSTIKLAPSQYSSIYDHHQHNEDFNNTINLSHTVNLKSWSPIVFPLRQPLTVTDDTELLIYLSRNYDRFDKKIWYEWYGESFVYLVMSNLSLNNHSHNNTTSTSNNTNTDKNNRHSHRTSGSSYLDKTKRLQNCNEEQFKGNDENDDYNDDDIDDDDDTNFLNGEHENAWQSVNDMHDLVNSNMKMNSNDDNKPTFNLLSTSRNHNNNTVNNTTTTTTTTTNNKSTNSNHNNRLNNRSNLTDEGYEEEEIIHTKVRTGVSLLHNVSGKHFNIPL
ncbi:hypothetical protein TBLA_0C02500 [Henningerozyma blattae CBS 6284]|uniref:Protein arginine N-methyltransferase n=1 Tax=Henningerozyma blattae (strain ATCC 34711 / CBS 6284 / DSM 70876 / NBRC 10599 / NRRL Y-10934 / UCD 77-7) TaxID=1071380 RepID=I2H108_HENB6|nr:hypothetical protein TBLA_0C02500 [Tetrapisispora blattae CBS 6284]CCH60060.1 hypothetical protein TBLA_0C02500 [Tetrapisispora blattae CBS 6284]